MKSVISLVSALAFIASSSLAQTTLEATAVVPEGLTPAKTSTISRVVTSGTAAAPSYAFQWPGTYFETAFTGTDLYFKVGQGDVLLHVSVDAQALPPLAKPAPGFYHIGGLPVGSHTARIDVVSENQSSANHFDGFFVTVGEASQDVAKRAREIEFIGDSHTVGYGNTSPSRDCNGDQLFATTDNSQAFGPITARHYNADYQINAISGRGVVRNYGGGGGDLLPVAYPYILFDKSVTDSDATWQPSVVVIALGTNDFSPLNANEQWKSRDDLHADYEKHYVAFVQSLRQRYPAAYFVLWSIDFSGGEIKPEVQKVVSQLKTAGETKVIYVPVTGLDLAGCHYHPSIADDKLISEALVRTIDQLAVWPAQ